MSINRGDHAYGDERIVEWLQEPREWTYERNVPYHPRSNKHGEAQCQYFVDDLIHESEAIADAVANGEIVYQTDYDVGNPRGLGWNVDLVLGPPSGDVQQPVNDEPVRATPGDVWLAADAKAILTEHQKARRNRQRDINSFADILHSHFEESLTCGILLINSADKFDSPTRDLDDLTEHPDEIDRLVAEIVDLFDSINKSEGELSPNLDGAACIVVEHTNLPAEIDQTRLVTEHPAPAPVRDVHYRTFVNNIAQRFEERFL